MIYFIKSESGHVKIGYTKNGVTIRLKNLQCGNPYPLSVMRVIKGHTGLESALHTRFGDLRCVGEWFVLTDELKNFIETFQEPLDIEIREETDSEKDIKALIDTLFGEIESLNHRMLNIEETIQDIQMAKDD